MTATRYYPVGELFRRLRTAHDMDEVTSILAHLSDIAREWKRSGRAQARELQEASSCLTQIRLVLKNMEREEVLDKGVSSYVADKYAVLERVVRAVNADLQSVFHNGMP